MSEIENNPTIHTFYVDAPYYGPPQIFTTERETVALVHPDGTYLSRCMGVDAEEDERTGYIPTTVIWNIIVRDINNAS
jgi:hypothetical protein